MTTYPTISLPNDRYTYEYELEPGQSRREARRRIEAVLYDGDYEKLREAEDDVILSFVNGRQVKAAVIKVWKGRQEGDIKATFKPYYIIKKGEE